MLISGCPRSLSYMGGAVFWSGLRHISPARSGPHLGTALSPPPRGLLGSAPSDSWYPADMRAQGRSRIILLPRP